MTRKKSKNDNVVEIDPEIYECLALRGMELGRDDVTEFINDVIYYELRRLREEES